MTDKIIDEINNDLPENDFDRVVESAISRRGFLGGALVFGGTAALAGTGLLSSATAMAASSSRFGFESIPTSTKNTVTLPEGYSWQVVRRWGDPINNKFEFDPTSTGDAEYQENAVGDNNDGMAIFNVNGHQILVGNNEYTNNEILMGTPDGMPKNEDDVRKSKAAHGVTITEIKETDGKWSIVKDSPYNHKITAETEIELSGPAAGHELLKTDADPEGKLAKGTWNNCGNGRTPWGTYLACEENFDDYFGYSDESYELSPELQRYGVKQASRYGWEKFDDRFDVSKNPNEPNRHGYIVEIDPSKPEKKAIKRTAMGRIKHENVELVINKDGHAVAYMGDDERGEFLYRFVSDKKYSPTGDNSDLLDSGTLYAAKFHDNMIGEWLALTPETTGMKDRAEISIHTRQAASTVGATTMDRPEWVAANPNKAEVYCCLTNNKNRGVKPNAGGDPTPVGGPNPRRENHYGQIVRWRPVNEDHTTNNFSWDLYVIAGNPTVHDDAYAGSDNLTEQNMFNSPDGLAFDSQGMLWIQTDGNYSNEGDFAGHGNNQMLAGDPATGEIRRFMTGPEDCEVTGFAWSSDRRTMFVGIQHPHAEGEEQFPDGANTLPRSSIIAISRDDGKIIG